VARVSANGIHIYFEVAGAGLPVLLLHANPTDHAIWQLQMPVLSADYRVLALDLRGYGQSDKPSGANTPAVMAADVVAFMDELGIAQAAVCGLSLGGIVAAQMTVSYSSRVACSIWVGAASHGYGDPWPPGLDTHTEEPKLSLVDQFIPTLLADGYVGFWSRLWKPAAEALLSTEFVASTVGQYLMESLFEDRYVRLNQDVRPIIAVLEGLRHWTVLDGLGNIVKPVLVVTGENDQTLPYCEEEAKLIPGSEYVVIGNSGHFVNLTRPAEFNRTVLSFLKREYSPSFQAT
jgi:pimeloyl-ACP methyl ester carboxylesterase